MEILSEAILQREFRGIADPDQAWILGELIAYLQHPSSGAMDFQDTGRHWVRVRDAVRDGRLRAADEGMGRRDRAVGSIYAVHLPVPYARTRSQGNPGATSCGAKQNDPSMRKATLVRRLVESGILDGTIRVQNAAGDIGLAASLRMSTVTASLSLTAPDDGRPTTRINWLVKDA